MADDNRLPKQRIGLGALICGHIVLCCVSLFYVAHFQHPNAFQPAQYHMLYNPARLYLAAIAVACFAPVSLLFVYSRFSFGYFAGFGFYTMIAGYLWLNCFSDMDYDHQLAGFSAAISAVAFLLPAMLISSPIRQTYVLSEKALQNLLRLILLLGFATGLAGAVYNFRIVNLETMYDYRSQLEFPRVVTYAIGITSGALLPYAFACFVMRAEYLKSAAVLLPLLLFFPVNLSKFALFAPAWLIIFALLSKFFRARYVVILSLFVPLLLGVVLNLLLAERAISYFAIVNFRMFALTSAAMDVYNDFFSRHDLTHFCQIAVLKPVMPCAYQDPLSAVMQATYKIGYFNASLFATEGIASVGVWFAPIAALMCGLVIALANGLSAGLPTRFVLISGALLSQLLLNIPMSTVLLTHGAGLLFLLWYVTPRATFHRETSLQAPTGG
jgi:hypothetical protein